MQKLALSMFQKPINNIINSQQKITRSRLMSNKKNIKYLLIKLLELQNQQGGSQPIFQQHSVYFSFRINENQNMHFSSCMPSQNSSLSDDIIICVENMDNIDIMYLYRWQNHMIMFTYEVDVTELKTRRTTMKKIETKVGQTLKMLISSVNQQQIKLGIKFVQSITQHYLIIDQISVIKNQNNKQTIGPTFFKISTSTNGYILPVMNGQVLLKLPETIQFFQIKDGIEVSKSQQYSHQDLSHHEMIIQMLPINRSKPISNIQMKLRWAINLLQTKSENTLLLDSQQIMLYDIEVKFDNYSEFGNSKVKFVYGNKSFEIGSDFNSAKPSKIKKIINLVIKSEDEQIYIVAQRSLKVVAQTKFQAQQIAPYTLHLLKKKFMDLTNKPIGVIKFRCEKGKNLSTPTNNKIWRDSLKNKNSPGALIYILNQISVKYPKKNPINLHIKTESQQRFIDNLSNIQDFDENNEVKNSPISLLLKQDQSLYLILKSDSDKTVEDSSDFIGIALFNPSTCRLGENCSQLKFFKNQTHAATLNFIGNKIIGYPFLRPTFQPQLLQSLSHRTISLSVIIRQVYFSAFFYTYRYDNKNQVYSIVQINRLKKVLILQNKNKSNELSFNCSASSDNLDFSVQQAETIRVKITFLVSDIGQDQQIYGHSLIKIRTDELGSSGTGLKFYLVEIKNQFGNVVGQINVEVHKALLFNSYEKQSRDVLQSGTKTLQNDKRRAKMHVSQINQNIQFKEKPQFFKNQLQSVNLKNISRQPSKDIKLPPKSGRYEKSGPSLTGQRRQRNNSVIGVQGSIKLPSIRQDTVRQVDNAPVLKDKKSHNQFVQMMKIRKRSIKGHYQQNSMLQSYQMRNYTNLRGLNKNQNYQHPESFLLKQKIEKQNPNLERNMEILFPKKNQRLQKNSSFKPSVSQQEQRLKGLKSVLSQITSDMKQIEPTVKDYGRNKNESRRSEIIQQNLPFFQKDDQKMQGPEWDDNQFAN